MCVRPGDRAATCAGQARASVYPSPPPFSPPSVERPRLGISFPRGFPCPPPSACLPAAASLPDGPRGAGCLAVSSEREGRRWGGGRASSSACWPAALAQCPAASLTGCQLAPRVPGPVSLPCVFAEKGGEAGGGHATRPESGGRQAWWAAWAGCFEGWLSPSSCFLPPPPGWAGWQAPSSACSPPLLGLGPARGWAPERPGGPDRAAGGGQVRGGVQGTPRHPQLQAGLPAFPLGNPARHLGGQPSEQRPGFLLPWQSSWVPGRLGLEKPPGTSGLGQGLAVQPAGLLAA